MANKIERIGVVGAGQMGSGIAQVAATSGFIVVMSDVSGEALQRGRAGIDKSLGRLLQKERITQQQLDDARDRLTATTHLAEACAGADLVIEAATENEALKLEIFRTLDEHAPSHAILATNTSSIPITRIAAATARPEQVIGMHFMNPVPIMKLVELIRGLATSDGTYQATLGVAESMGKTTVEAQDYPGFVVNRILMPMINEAVYTLMEGVGTAGDIDRAMKLGTNQPMGPLELADFIGLDTCLAIMEVLHRGTGDSKYRPCPLLRKHVDAGWLGRKSGRGFHDYSSR